jgi:hypothetical protein
LILTLPFLPKGKGKDDVYVAAKKEVKAVGEYETPSLTQGGFVIL